MQTKFITDSPNVQSYTSLGVVQTDDDEDKGRLSLVWGSSRPVTPDSSLECPTVGLS